MSQREQETQESVRYLMRALYATIGNKRYLNDLEELLARLGTVSGEEEQTLLMLARDIRDIEQQSTKPRIGLWV